MGKPSKLMLTGKEWLMLIFGTALALGSFKSDDPWVVIPMLSISAIAFTVLCVLHKGDALKRAGEAVLLVVILIFIGWRDLRKYSSPVEVVNPPSTTVTPPLVQKSKDSNCSNIVGGHDVKVNCQEKDNGKNKH